MYDRSLKHLSLDDVNRLTNSTATPLIDLRDNEIVIKIKPINSVIKYDLNSERTKGTMGQLVLTNFRLKFIPYSIEQNKNNLPNGQSNLKEESVLDGDQVFPPFEFVSTNESKIEEDVEYLNIYDLICEQNLLQIYCSDFRCLEFQFRTALIVKSLASYLERLIIKPVGNSPMSQLSQNLSSPSISGSNNSINKIAANRDYELTYFWSIISSQYQFNYPKDWEFNEGYWYLSNNLLRISQANENYQLCKSLPASFITLKYYLTDINLLQNISAKMKGQRVPVITFSIKCKSRQTQLNRLFNQQIKYEDHMLIRSSIINKEVSYSLIQAISPLNIIEVNDYLPDVATFVSIYLKLRDACFLHSNETHFLSQIGKWMKLICKVLSIVNDLSKTLSEESSLLLMETNDDHWNILLSCLIQIQLDKNRRTIEGFNSLLSKEWLYLVSGLRNKSKLDHNKLPNQILFTLFLDCVYQMLYQNPTNFEFTSLYLIRCFDLSFKPLCSFIKPNGTEQLSTPLKQYPTIKRSFIRQSPISKHSLSPVQFSKITLTANYNNSFNSKYNYSNHSFSPLSPVIQNLTFTQTLFYFNPFYNKKQNDNSKLKISSGILFVQFWRSLYLRWFKPFRNLNYYNQFLKSEYIYFKELVEKNSGFKQIVVQSTEKTNSSLTATSPNDLEDSFEHF